jgi:hypothetical protein
MIKYLKLLFFLFSYSCIDSNTKNGNASNRLNNKNEQEYYKSNQVYNENIFTKYTNDDFLISLKYHDSCICIENTLLFEIYNIKFKNEMTYFEFYKSIQSNKIKINWRENGVTSIYANITNFDNMSIDDIIFNYFKFIDKSSYVLDTLITEEEKCNLIKKISKNFYYIKQSDYSGELYLNKTITYPPRLPIKN